MPEHQLQFFPPRRPLVERFGVEFFRTVPERPGVYLMCGAGDGVLYVGKASQLRRRLGSYRSANPERLSQKIRRLLPLVERIYWDECADEAAALARERELLLTLRPRFNTVGTYPAPQLHLGWLRTSRGLAFGCGESTKHWSERHGPLSAGRLLHTATMRLLWWTLYPALGWNQMPMRLQQGNTSSVWEFALTIDEAHELSLRLAHFFTGHSPELVEWAVGIGASRPRFERTWIHRDALALLDYFEKITANVRPSLH